jgi:hypothetical protein
LELLLMAAAAWAVGSWSMGRYFESGRRIRRLLGRTPLTDLGSAQDGRLQHFRGRLSGPSVTAPLTGRRCIYYRVQVEKFFRGRWKIVSTDESAGELLFTDGSHQAVVRLQHALLDVVMTEVSGPQLATMELSGDMRVRESVLFGDVIVDVAALVRLEPDPSQTGGYREAALRPLLQSNSRIPLFVSAR